MRRGPKGGREDAQGLWTDTEDKDCCVCACDIYLSAVVCLCRPGEGACLRHAREMCECAGERRMLLYRWTVEEMRGLVEGKALPPPWEEDESLDPREPTPEPPSARLSAARCRRSASCRAAPERHFARAARARG